MQNFTKRISIGSGYAPEFFFNRIYTVSGVRYHVSVMDNNKQSYAFNMEQKGQNWKIINAPKLPEWIMNVESELEKAIFLNLIGVV